MATLKQRLHRKNSSGSYDTIYLETLASLVKMDDGTTLTSKISTMDTAISGKAASNHTHSGYAASSHNHSASNITSGTLSASRGGTGQSSITPSVGTSALRAISGGTSSLTASSSSLTTGAVYLTYE